MGPILIPDSTTSVNSILHADKRHERQDCLKLLQVSSFCVGFYVLKWYKNQNISLWVVEFFLILHPLGYLKQGLVISVQIFLISVHYFQESAQ